MELLGHWSFVWKIDGNISKGIIGVCFRIEANARTINDFPQSRTRRIRRRMIKIGEGTKWTPREHKTLRRPEVAKVVAPPPRLRPTIVVRLSRPLVIPFEGAYWYFRFLAKAPGRSAHIAQGTPTRISIDSTGWHPLILEAHQRLASPIDPRCCRELDLSILNADNPLGAIRIAVELIDSSWPNVQREDLGVHPVRSSMPSEFNLNRPLNERSAEICDTRKSRNSPI